MDAAKILAERFGVELEPWAGLHHVMDAIADQKSALFDRAVAAEQRVAQLEAGQRATERLDACEAEGESARALRISLAVAQNATISKLRKRIAELEEAAQYPPPMETARALRTLAAIDLMNPGPLRPNLSPGTNEVDTLKAMLRESWEREMRTRLAAVERAQ